MSVGENKETLSFQTEVKQLLHLMIHSLYSHKEIFLRELISNGTDATLKLKHLTSIGEAKVDYGNPIIEVKIDKEGKKLHIIDQGLGMTADEVEKYINQKGKQIIGWDEILEGGLAPNAAVMSWRGTEGGIAAAKQKHYVVRTPGSHCYFDHYQ